MKYDSTDSPSLPSTPPSTRSYRSPLRQQQAAATRQLILEALAEQLAQDGLQDFSIAQAAERAGVSPRTIYRYFPNRDAVLTALGEWVDQQLGDLPYPQTADEILALIYLAFARFDQQASLVRALLMTNLGKSVRSPLRVKRRQSIADALTPLVADLDPVLAQGISAIMQHLISANLWQILHDEYGVSGHVSGPAVVWVMQVLLAELQHPHHSPHPLLEPSKTNYPDDRPCPLDQP